MIQSFASYILGFGIVFELPVLVYVLSKFDIITPKFLRTYLKYACVVILIVAAVITPSPRLDQPDCNSGSINTFV